MLDPASVVHDYGMVCDALHVAAERAGLRVDPVEAQVVSRWIDSAIADAITAYWRRDVEQRRDNLKLSLGTLVHELRNDAQVA